VYYFNYRQGDRTITTDDKNWSLGGWFEATKKGPTIRPLQDYVIALQDPYPEQTGLIFHPEDSMDSVNHPATVIAVPEVEGKGPGFWKTTKIEEGRTREIFIPIALRPGDRIVTIRFIGYDRLVDPYSPRLRMPRYDEIWGLEAS
tara:strand:+ start:834 stop:1268 length:435 start_codon:yes stop_codon:yes gene_type:complete